MLFFVKVLSHAVYEDPRILIYQHKLFTTNFAIHALFGIYFQAN